MSAHTINISTSLLAILKQGLVAIYCKYLQDKKAKVATTSLDTGELDSYKHPNVTKKHYQAFLKAKGIPYKTADSKEKLITTIASKFGHMDLIEFMVSDYREHPTHIPLNEPSSSPPATAMSNTIWH